MSSVGGIGAGGSSTYGMMTGSSGAAASGTTASDANTDKQFADMLSGGTSSKDRTANAQKELQEITTGGFKGYWAWKIKQIKAQAAQEVMGSMNLSPQQLAAMPSGQRAEIERKIMRIVEEKVRKMLKQQNNGQSGSDAANASQTTAAGGAGQAATDVPQGAASQTAAGQAATGQAAASQGVNGLAADSQGNGGLTGNGTAASGSGPHKNKWLGGIPALSSSVLSTLLTTQEIKA